MTSNTNAEGILQGAVDQLVIERDELRAENKALEDQAFDLTERLLQCSAESERLRATINDLVALIRNVDADANNVQLDIAKLLRRHRLDA